MLESFFQDGRIIWLIMALVVAEAIVLSMWLLRRNRVTDVAGLLANLAAGACLMAAIGALLAGWGLPALALLMALSLVAHVLDLWQRLRS